MDSIKNDFSAALVLAAAAIAGFIGVGGASASVPAPPVVRSADGVEVRQGDVLQVISKNANGHCVAEAPVVISITPDPNSAGGSASATVDKDCKVHVGAIQSLSVGDSSNDSSGSTRQATQIPVPGVTRP